MADVEGGAPAASVEEFSATNAVLLGVLHDLLLAGQQGAADAWTRAHTAFVSEGKGVTLVITPADELDEAVLREGLATIDAALGRYAGYSPISYREALRLSFRPCRQHPNAGERRKALLAAVEGARAESSGDEHAVLSRFLDLVDRARLGAARSFCCGDYDLFTIDGLDDDEQGFLQRIVYDSSDLIFQYQKRARRVNRPSAGLNNFSPAVGIVYASDLVAASLVSGTRGPAATQDSVAVVGVITAGGSAASSDVIGKLQLEGPALELVPRVVPRSSPSLSRTMHRALDDIKDHNPVAVVIGYGGGQRHELDAIVEAIRPECEHPSQPLYVGIGHSDYDRKVAGPGVRWCTTPSAAAELFRVEALTAPRKRLRLLEEASAAIRVAMGDPVKTSEIVSRLESGLEAVRSELEASRTSQLQP